MTHFSFLTRIRHIATCFIPSSSRCGKLVCAGSWIIPLVLGAIYLATRLPFLMMIPAFLDEALHVDFAKKALCGNLSSGLMLGKWLSIQFYGLVFGLLGETLFAARLVPVALGLATMVLFLIPSLPEQQRRPTVAGVVSAVLYILLPYTVFYDRLALVDQTQTVLLALMLFLAFRLLSKPSSAYRIMLAFTLMALPMFKYSGFFLLPIPILVTMFVTPRAILASSFRQLLMAYTVAAPALIAFYYKGTPTRELGKMINFNDWNAALSQVAINGKDVLVIFKTLLSPALAVALLAAIMLALIRKDTANKRRIVALIAVFAFIVIPYVLLFRHWYPRYLLPAIVPVCLLGGELMTTFTGANNPLFRRLAIVAFLFIAATTACDSVQIIRNPLQKPDLPVIRRLYTTGWSSGYGLTNAVAAINQCARQHPGTIRVARSARWGIHYQGFKLYEADLAPNVAPVLIYNWSESIIEQTLCNMLSRGVPLYLLFNSTYTYQSDKGVINTIRQKFTIREVAHFEKPGGKPSLVLWQVSLPESPEKSVADG